MLGYFPTPFADELLYSVCGRAFAVLRPASRKRFCEDLFDVSSTAVVDFPSRLKHLAAQLPPSHPLTAERIVAENTLLPLFLPFLPIERAERCRRLMIHGNAKSIQLLTGATAGSLRPPTNLRLCPACFEEETLRHDEPYWHRSHQIEGVEYCHRHHTRLVPTKVRRRNRYNRHGFHLPTRDWEPREGKPNPQDLRLSHDTHWLLNENTEMPGLHKLRGAYLRLLAERGFAHCNGRLRLNRLTEHFLAFHGHEFLERIHCRPEGDCNWLTKLLRPERTTSAHPVQHLLLLHAMGETASSFFAGLNRQSRQPEPKRTGTRPIRKKSLEYGILTGLWNNPAISLREIGRRFGVDPMTVKRHAATIGLGFPRKAIRPTRVKPHVPPSDRRYRLEFHQRNWLRALTHRMKNPRRALPTTYSYLFRFDRAWLDKHRPHPQPQAQRKSRVNWGERDARLARKVTELQKLGRNPRAIPAELGIVTMLRRNRTKLNQTGSLLPASEPKEQIKASCKI